MRYLVLAGYERAKLALAGVGGSHQHHPDRVQPTVQLELLANLDDVATETLPGRPRNDGISVRINQVRIVVEHGCGLHPQIHRQQIEVGVECSLPVTHMLDGTSSHPIGDALNDFALRVSVGLVDCKNVVATRRQIKCLLDDLRQILDVNHGQNVATIANNAELLFGVQPCCLEVLKQHLFTITVHDARADDARTQMQFGGRHDLQLEVLDLVVPLGTLAKVQVGLLDSRVSQIELLPLGVGIHQVLMNGGCSGCLLFLLFILGDGGSPRQWCRDEDESLRWIMLTIF